MGRKTEAKQRKARAETARGLHYRSLMLQGVGRSIKFGWHGPHLRECLDIIADDLVKKHPGDEALIAMAYDSIMEDALRVAEIEDKENGKTEQKQNGPSEPQPRSA